jgi:hypothetical protein
MVLVCYTPRQVSGYHTVRCHSFVGLPTVVRTPHLSTHHCTAQLALDPCYLHSQPLQTLPIQGHKHGDCKVAYGGDRCVRNCWLFGQTPSYESVRLRSW